MEQKMFDDVKEFIKNLCLMNNKFMNKMLDGNIEAAQIMLRVILKNDKIVVKYVRIQNFIQNLYGHSAQLDILAQDENGRYFNVEVQRSDEGAPLKRLYYREFGQRMRFLKYTKEGEEKMTDIIELYAENKARKAAYAEKIQIAQTLLADGESAERTAQLTKLSLEEVRKLVEKYSA